MRRGKRPRIVDNFVTHRKEMRESIAWQYLPDEARRVLFQLELEHMRHGGACNADLVCPYADFQREAGVRRNSIALAVRQCAALGFVEITNRGRRSAAMFRNPSTYRLTYVFGRGTSPPPTDDWRKIETADDARAALGRAAAAKSEEHVRRATTAKDDALNGAPLHRDIDSSPARGAKPVAPPVGL